MKTVHSFKPWEEITQSHGTITQKTCYINNPVVETSKHYFLIVKSIYLPHLFCFVDAWLILNEIMKWYKSFHNTYMDIELCEYITIVLKEVKANENTVQYTCQYSEVSGCHDFHSTIVVLQSKHSLTQEASMTYSYFTFLWNSFIFTVLKDSHHFQGGLLWKGFCMMSCLFHMIFDVKRQSDFCFVW